jgi:hypothetical protein
MRKKGITLLLLLLLKPILQAESFSNFSPQTLLLKVVQNACLYVRMFAHSLYIYVLSTFYTLHWMKPLDHAVYDRVLL